ncbi:MAG: YbaB/EbfC family nucleoid-associated protein [Bacillota bacterium]
MLGNFDVGNLAKLGNFTKIMEDLGRLKEELRRLTLEAEAGDGAVRITFNGLQEVLRVRIAPEAAANVGRLEAMVASCFNQGSLAVREKAKEEAARVTGLNLPDVMNFLNL